MSSKHKTLPPAKKKDKWDRFYMKKIKQMFYIFTYLTTVPNAEEALWINLHNKRKWRHNVASRIHKVAVFSHDIYIQ